jgi:hypothetical protein
MRRPSSTTLRLAAFSFLAALGLWWPAFREPFATGFGDWQFFHHMWEAGYVALTRHGEWPLWDPYHCGGITIFGNPQNQLMSPLYLLAFVAGPTLGSKLFVVVHAWAGFAGTYLLARVHGLQLPAAGLAALAWSACGFFAWHGGTGHAAFMPFYFAPWVLLALQRTLAEPRWAAALAALLSLVLLEGGVYPFPFFLVLIAVALVPQLTAASELPRQLLGLGLAALLTGLLGALRLWPIADELSRNPRTMPSQDALSWAEVLTALTAREHGWRVPGHPFVWSEYGCYVGFPVCALALLGVVAAVRGRRYGLLASALVFLLLLMGERGPYWPWPLLHRLPVFDSLRVPTRFLVFFALYLALLAGLGLQQLLQLLERALPPAFARRSQRLGLAVVAALAIDFGFAQYPALNHWKYHPIRSEPVSPRFYLTGLAYGDWYASFPRLNLGSRHCYEAMNFEPAQGLWLGDEPQARIVRGRGSLGAVERTSSRAWFDVDLRTPARVVINQNLAPGWRSNYGEIVSDHGRLALRLPAGRRRVELRYRPEMLWPSLALSALGALLALSIWRRPWSRRRAASRSERAAPPP